MFWKYFTSWRALEGTSPIRQAAWWPPRPRIFIPILI
jgi:hypothetical protein